MMAGEGSQPYLQYVIEKNLLVQLANGEYRFSSVGHSKLKRIFYVEKPEIFFKRRVGDNLSVLTTWELSDLLLETGWVFAVLPPRKRNRILRLPSEGPVIIDNDKKIFLRAKASLSRWYCLALASLDILRDQGVRELKHGEKENYYKEFVINKAAET